MNALTTSTSASKLAESRLLEKPLCLQSPVADSAQSEAALSVKTRASHHPSYLQLGLSYFMFPFVNDSKLSDLSSWPSHLVQNLDLSHCNCPSKEKDRA
jgi:hypothetical protein